MPEIPPDSRVDRSLPAERVLHALVALAAADRDEQIDSVPPRRSELVLADVGFSYQEIATMTGKNREAVRSTLRRLTKEAKSKDGK